MDGSLSCWWAGEGQRSVHCKACTGRMMYSDNLLAGRCQSKGEQAAVISLQGGKGLHRF